jgi:DNA-binding GntR family transcriptional regulator
MNAGPIDHSRPPRGTATSGGTLTSVIARQLREAILSGQIAPGERLRLNELSTCYGVSLSPLREALSRLSSEGLVLNEDRRGVRVAPVSASNCHEIVMLRLELESLGLREAIRHGDEDWEGAVVVAFHRLSKIETRGWSVDGARTEWERLNKNFHQALISGSGMPVLIQMCATLSDMYDRYRRLFLERHAPDPAVPAEHEAIFRATIARDDEEAMRLLRHHIQRTSKNVLPFVRQGPRSRSAGA